MAPQKSSGDTPTGKNHPRPHPHFEGVWNGNNTIYHGPAAVARRAATSLRLTSRNAPLNLWTVPPWLRELGLTYHGQETRWIGETQLDSVKRGQEFVCNIRDDEDAHSWLKGTIREIERGRGFIAMSWRMIAGWRRIHVGT